MLPHAAAGDRHRAALRLRGSPRYFAGHLQKVGAAHSARVPQSAALFSPYCLYAPAIHRLSSASWLTSAPRCAARNWPSTPRSSPALRASPARLELRGLRFGALAAPRARVAQALAQPQREQVEVSVASALSAGRLFVLALQRQRLRCGRLGLQHHRRCAVSKAVGHRVRRPLHAARRGHGAQRAHSPASARERVDGTGAAAAVGGVQRREIIGSGAAASLRPPRARARMQHLRQPHPAAGQHRHVLEGRHTLQLAPRHPLRHRSPHRAAARSRGGVSRRCATSACTLGCLSGATRSSQDFGDSGITPVWPRARARCRSGRWRAGSRSW